MAIKINKGTSVPQAGRITMPKGTYLSNPSTIADGSLGGSSGMNPAGPQVNMWGSVTPGYNTQLPGYSTGEWYSPIYNAFTSVGNALNQTDQYLRGVKFTPPNLGPLAPIARFGDSLVALAENVAAPADKAAQDKAAAALRTSPTQNQYAPMPTATDYGSVIPIAIANQNGADQGLSPEQVAQKMIAAGFSQKWVEDLGQVWVQGGAASGQPAMAAGSRPDWVDGASLAPGESVTDAQGNRYVGGTPAPDGTPQYAVNYANPNAAKDTKGRYKWVSSVSKDPNGNWVRVNRQVLRKVYTRSHVKKAAAQQEAAAAAQEQAQQSPGEYNQLVNFRVGFG